MSKPLPCSTKLLTSKAVRKTYSNKLPEGPIDDIIIGSGMGGMVLAGILSKFGRRVCILEQHYVPGGMTHSFKRKKDTWNIGVHVIGEIAPNSIGGAVLNDLCETPIEWESLGEFYDRIEFPDEVFDLPSSEAAFKKALIEGYPKSESDIDLYFKKIKTGALKGILHFVYKSLPWHGQWAMGPWFRWGAKKWIKSTTQNVLENTIGDPKLRRLLSAQWGYYGTAPKHSSFVAHALVTQHFFGGGHYPKGGGSTFAEKLLSPVLQRGGNMSIRARVKHITIESGHACGIELEDGRKLRSRRVFSNAGAQQTCQLVENSKKTQRWRKQLNTLPPSMGHVSLFLSFDCDPRTLGCDAKNIWVYRQDSNDPQDIPFPETHFDPPGFWFSVGSLKDSNFNPGQHRHHAQVITFVPNAWFEPYFQNRWGHRGERYNALKSKIHDGLLKALLQRFPAFEGHLSYLELSTPASTHHFAARPKGSIYGLATGPDRMWSKHLGPKTPVKNLYLSGADVAIVGVVGALSGALMAAFAAMPIATIRYLFGVMRAARRSPEPS